MGFTVGYRLLDPPKVPILPRFQPERNSMNPDHYVSLLIGRAADARAMIMFFALYHTGILIV